MSLWKTALKTNRTLWLSVAALLFVAFGFWNPSPDTKGGFTYWLLWTEFLHSQRRAPLIGILISWTCGLAIPAVAIGWVLQGLLVAAIKLSRREAEGGSSSRATSHA